MIVPPCGHEISQEMPEQTAALLKAFLSGLGQAALKPPPLQWLRWQQEVRVLANTDKRSQVEISALKMVGPGGLETSDLFRVNLP